jgi:hypothetical protein
MRDVARGGHHFGFGDEAHVRQSQQRERHVISAEVSVIEAGFLHDFGMHRGIDPHARDELLLLQQRSESFSHAHSVPFLRQSINFKRMAGDC